MIIIIIIIIYECLVLLYRYYIIYMSSVIRQPFEGKHCESDICHLGSVGPPEITPEFPLKYCLKMNLFILELDLFSRRWYTRRLGEEMNPGKNILNFLLFI